MHPRHTSKGSMSGDKLISAMRTSLRRLAPLSQLRNPVMFVVYCGALFTSIDFVHHLGKGDSGFIAAIALTLWVTVLFANFSEAIAEERGKAQASTLKKTRQDIMAKLVPSAEEHNTFTLTPAQNLRIGDLVTVCTGDLVPADGQVVKGIATVDESAITGESAPVIRESGGDRDAVTGGTRILSDWIVIKITMNPGESYLDKMIAMVEGAKRQKTPNEIALGLLLSAMTIIFLVSCATLLPFSQYVTARAGSGEPIALTVLVALLVCLAPTTISGLLSAIGIAGMNRLMAANVIATSGRAVEAAGDVNVLLLDKTGTITLGNRQAVAFFPSTGVTPARLVKAALIASLSDETPEGKSIIDLARRQFNILPEAATPDMVFIPFSADTRMSGVTRGDTSIFKGAGDAIEAHIKTRGGHIPDDAHKTIETIARQGGTPLMVCEDKDILGVIHLKDIVKTGIKERMTSLRAMGIKSVMVTGDNPLTAAAIAAEAGVDDFIAQATPETKLKYIRKMQDGGELVAMVGDGTNDAPALAQADVAVAMNSGTQAAKEAANMIDLDSDPTKLIEVVEIGKQLLMTRGSLTTFSLANDIAKYFAILPAVFVSAVPGLSRMNLMGLSSPHSAILSSLVFNALIIVALIPLALRGVPYRAVGANGLLRRNLFIYGLGGILVPFIGIKAIDLLLVFVTGGSL